MGVIGVKQPPLEQLVQQIAEIVRRRRRGNSRDNRWPPGAKLPFADGECEEARLPPHAALPLHLLVQNPSLHLHSKERRPEERPNVLIHIDEPTEARQADAAQSAGSAEVAVRVVHRAPDAQSCHRKGDAGGWQCHWRGRRSSPSGRNIQKYIPLIRQELPGGGLILDIRILDIMGGGP
ncbi:hypothetical protein AB1Y20_004991 [Prymnesium parvum]|uniref:Uncharacterized protein n=1 Tax=Prymnesium parvum TaxID=97485 RepID=A0AB34J605_PRYPA